MKHENNGDCQKCLEILNRYPHFHDELRTWFVAVQIEHPDFHVSCGGRGRAEQEAAFARKASNAHYGNSAHNYNCALDAFQLKDNEAHWEKPYFEEVVGKNLYSALKWYGSPGAKFYELPHIEVSNWKDLVLTGEVHLVEP